MAVNYTDIHRTHHPLGFDAPDLGIKTYSYIEDYMLLNVTNAFNLGGGTESEARFQTPTYSVGDDVTMVRGNHQFGFGGSLAYWKSLSSANVRSPGVFTFNGSVTGLPLTDFLTGNLFEFVQAVPNIVDMEQWYTGLYAQDTWRLNQKMTLNYGVRWEPGLAQQLRNGAVYNFSIDRFLRGERTRQFLNAPPGFLYPGDEGFVNDQAGMRNKWLQFSPRVGFAWDPSGEGRMSIRSGYSLGYTFRQRPVSPRHVDRAALGRRDPFPAARGRLRRSVFGNRPGQLHAVRGKAGFAVSAGRPVYRDRSRHRSATATVVEPRRAAADRR